MAATTSVKPATAIGDSHLVDMNAFLPGRMLNDETCLAACRLLEEGKILYFAQSPFPLPPEDIDVLLRQRQSDRRWHKNIAYRPLQDRLTGFDPKHSDAARMHEIMRSFSRRLLDYAGKLLPAYARVWRLDYASFRPLEEQGRQLRLQARNDLVHVDSFPKRPTHGDRILRMFTNINPHAERHWITSDPLDELARQMGKQFAEQFVPATGPALWRRWAVRAGLSLRPYSAYDEAMRGIHRRMKESTVFQQYCRKHHSHFPPGSAWLVFTDAVPHAVVSGQYALEQTVIVPRSAMLLPERSPAAVLERLATPERKQAA
ncbi:MAG TPA: Kdo hydroxylase family protein [Pirellulales bacterium]|nr:Kdo hydroxylase family protein [Pirellulales bacterium]